jgi:hypothetical protein
LDWLWAKNLAITSNFYFCPSVKPLINSARPAKKKKLAMVTTLRFTTLRFSVQLLSLLIFLDKQSSAQNITTTSASSLACNTTNRTKCNITSVNVTSKLHTTTAIAVNSSAAKKRPEKSFVSPRRVPEIENLYPQAGSLALSEMVMLIILGIVVWQKEYQAI